jgi:hypothetical protein
MKLSAQKYQKILYTSFNPASLDTAKESHIHSQLDIHGPQIDLYITMHQIC